MFTWQLLKSKASLVAQRLKRLPLMQETWVRSLGQEDALEKEMASHSSILAWRIPWTEETGGLYSPRGHKESDTTERLNFNFNFMHWLQWLTHSKHSINVNKQMLASSLSSMIPKAQTTMLWAITYKNYLLAQYKNEHFKSKRSTKMEIYCLQRWWPREHS